MNRIEREKMLLRYARADKWLTRIYDLKRSPEHRVALWDFLMVASSEPLKNILIFTNSLDKEAATYWDTYGRN